MDGFPRPAAVLWGSTGLNPNTLAFLFIITSSGFCFHKLAVGYHFYADDSQMYVPLQKKDVFYDH